jgi:4-diphosphocytidyl-2-C-methyl-D-erythritol kinase
MPSLRVLAYAKLNLSLKVLYKRPDSYHEIRTIFQTISLADTLSLEWTPQRRGPAVIELEDALGIPNNLVERAARLVLDANGSRGQLRMKLTKRIPMGAGLGGGSSDAAAVLMALPALTGRPVAEAKLQEIAAGLGSDVPFFLLGGCALAMGRGEELYRLPDPPPAAGIVAASGVHVSTPEAYRGLARRNFGELTDYSQSAILNRFQALARSLADRQPAPQWQALCENDFESGVFRQYPRLQSLKRKLQRLGGRPALMTGSGSAIFALFEPGGIREVVERARTETGVEVHPVRFVSRGSYAARWRRWLAAGK